MVETLFLSNILGKDDEGKSDIVYQVKLVKKSDYGRTDVQETMKKEREKYKLVDAIEIVNDEGQKMIWMEKTSQLSLDFIRSDSPTAGKDSLKLALIVAAKLFD